MAENAQDNEKKEKEKEEGKENEAGTKEQQQSQQGESQQKKQQDEKDKQIAELKDRLLRLVAEFDNYRKRAAEDMKSAKDLGKAELIAKLLPAIDSFEIAISSIIYNPEQREKDKGFELVFSEFYDTLKKEGLEEIDTKGKYDPYKHEVVLTRPSDKEDGTIIEVIRKGYAFNGILLRPASVIISSGKKNDA
ncbi:MAG: nucleotide exchange factor GrpE [Candidatus Micrarchaeia archaeon]